MTTFVGEERLDSYDDETDETMVDGCRGGCAVRHDAGLQGYWPASGEWND